VAARGAAGWLYLVAFVLALAPGLLIGFVLFDATTRPAGYQGRWSATR
jgi:hypothetical protein